MAAQLKVPAPLRIRLDGAALAANFENCVKRAGVPAIPAVKADGYGLGAAAVVSRLETAGAREFAVSTWNEALELNRPDLPVLILHGFTADAAPAAAALPLARPVLATPGQCAAWNQAFPGRSADLMVETGMNRLGLSAGELSAAHDIPIEIVHSHFACADVPDHPHTPMQIAAFREIAALTPDARHALANSAGICRGREASFSAVRPGLALYGGEAYPGVFNRRVATPEARILQVRDVSVGQAVGYGATWIATRPSRVAILNIGYADGVLRALAPHLKLEAAGKQLNLAGRISMDMLAADVTDADLTEGDWVKVDWDLPRLSAAIGCSQYELLVLLGQRFDRIWE